MKRLSLMAIMSLLMFCGVAHTKDLLDFARENDCGSIRAVLQDTAVKPNAKGLGGVSAIHCAAGYGNVDAFDLLADDERTDLLQTVDQGMSALHFAAGFMSPKDLKHVGMRMRTYLHARNLSVTDLHQTTINGNNPLVWAAAFNTPDAFDTLVSYFRFDPYATNNLGYSVIPFAAKFGNYKMLRYLLNPRKNFQKLLKGKDGIRAIHWAAARGDQDMVELLVRKGVDIEEAWNEYGMNPLHTAAGAGQSAMVTYLLKEYPDVDASDQNQHTYAYWDRLYKQRDQPDKQAQYRQNYFFHHDDLSPLLQELLNRREGSRIT